MAQEPHVNQLEILIKAALENNEKERDRKEACILSVPKALVGDNGKFYYPQVLSIGPYHNYSPNYVPEDNLDKVEHLTHADKERRKLLHGMETDKLVAANKFWGLDSIQKNVHAIRMNHKQIIDQYDRDLSGLKSEKLAEMLFIDVAFVLEFLNSFVRGLNQGSYIAWGKQEENPIFQGRTNNPVLFGILMDLIKLENHVPMFIPKQSMENQLPKFNLEQSFNHISNAKDLLEPLLRHFCAYVSPIKSQHPWPRDAEESVNLCLTDCKHILDCIRKTIVSNSGWDKYKQQKGWNPAQYSLSSYSEQAKSSVFSCVHFLRTKFSRGRENTNEEKRYLPFGASKLEKAGVVFEVLEHGGIWDISFDKKTGILWLPKVDVGLWTETLLRNLLALEACYSREDIRPNSKDSEKVITRFVLLMSQLVESKEDAGVLREEGIIEDNLGDNGRVKQLWNDISSSRWVPQCDKFDRVTQDLNSHVAQRWVALFIEGWEAFCSRPWFVLAVVASIIVLVDAITSIFMAIRGGFK